MNRRRILGLALAASALPGCGDHEVDWVGGVTSSSAHFRYHAREDDERACSDVHSALERHLQVMTAELGIDWPDEAVIDYYKFRDARDYEESSGCPEHLESCYSGAGIRSPHAMNTHELIHAYTAPHWGGSAPLLREGIAVALSCRPWGRVGQGVAWQDAFAGVRDADLSSYRLAGALVTHLLSERGGMSRFEQLYRGVSASSSASHIESVFQSVYGASLESVWSGLFARVQIPVCLPVWACAADELAEVDEVGPTCAGSGERVFRTDSPSVLLTEGPGLRAVSCDRGGREVFLGGEQPELGALRGQHFWPALGERFALTRIGEGYDITTGAEPTRTELRAAGAWSSATCAEPEAVRLPPDATSTFVMPEAGQKVHVLADGERQLGASADGVAAFCEDCEAGCVDVISFTMLPRLESAVLEMRAPLGLGAVRVHPVP
ncbi:hypothetical protein [Sorangium sp. So ce131]|uniref:hypothetical protein n=1 Tax=Sorangium sp. So ce131 TaxID=3133282 RepID=UPI003F61900B